MRKRNKLYFRNKHQHTPRKITKIKSLKHHIQSLSRMAYCDYVEDLIKPKDENSRDEKFSISKTILYFYQTQGN